MIEWFDLSPMRPDEFAATDAERWNEAVAMRNEIAIGRQDAAGELKAQQALEAMAGE